MVIRTSKFKCAVHPTVWICLWLFSLSTADFHLLASDHPAPSATASEGKNGKVKISTDFHRMISADETENADNRIAPPEQKSSGLPSKILQDSKTRPDRIETTYYLSSNSSWTGIRDHNADGYFDLYNLSVGLCGYASESTKVYHAVGCTQTGLVYISETPTILNGWETEYCWFDFDQSEFADIPDNTTLDFMVGLLDSTQHHFLFYTYNVFNESRFKADPPPPLYLLSVIPTAWAAPSTGGMSPPFNVTNPGVCGSFSYSITKESDWLNLSMSGGTTPGSFTVTAAPNNSGLPRNAAVTVTATTYLGIEESPKTIMISQSYTPPFRLVVYPDSWEAPGEGGTSGPVTVSNSGDGGLIHYSVSDDADWLTVSNSGGATMGTFTITAEPNESGAARNAAITVTSTSPTGVPGSPQTLAVHQQSGSPTFVLSVNPASIIFPATGGTSPAIDVANSGTGGPIPYAISDSLDWLTASIPGGTTPGEITLIADANTGAARSGTVGVTAMTPTGVPVPTQTIAVTQEAAGIGIKPVSPDSTASGADFWVDVMVGDPVPAFDLNLIEFELTYTQTEWLDFLGVEAGPFFGPEAALSSGQEGLDGRLGVEISMTSTDSVTHGTGVIARFLFRAAAEIPEGLTSVFRLDNISARDKNSAALKIGPPDTSVTTFTAWPVVWPGDTNDDGKVNQTDILPIGLYLHETGPARSGGCTDWIGQTCRAWRIPNEAVHADANGDGVVMESDTTLLRLNWGKTKPTRSPETTLRIIETASDTSQGMAIRPITPVSVFHSAGDTFSVVIEAVRIAGLFGAGFELNYDHRLVMPESNSPGSFLGGDFLYLAVSDSSKSSVCIGMTRKAGQTGVYGTGILMKVGFRTLPDVLDHSTAVFRIRSVVAQDSAGNSLAIAADSSVTRLTDVDKEPDLSTPSEYSLYPNHPNPFNSSTALRYVLASPGEVTVTIFDGMGRKITVLEKGFRRAGVHNLTFDGAGLTSGSYFCRLEAGGRVFTRRLVLVR